MKVEQLLPLDLQFFASEGNSGNDPAPTEPDNSGDGGNAAKGDNDDPKPMTQEEIDKIVEGRLGRERSSMRKDLAEEIKAQLIAEQDKAKQLEGMSEADKFKTQLEDAEQEKKDLEAKIARIDTEKQVTKMLADKDITANDDVLSLLVQDDMSAENIKDSVESFTSLVNELADQKVKQKMAGKTPNKFGASGVSSGSESQGQSFAERANESDKAPKDGLWN